MIQRHFRKIIVGLCVLFLPALALAGPDSTYPDLSVMMQVEGGNTWNGSPQGEANGNGTYSFVGQQTTSGWTVDWNMTVDPDPLINAGLVVTNNTALTQTYTLIATLPIAPPIPGGTLFGGSIQGGITDNVLDGSLATLTTDPVSGDPLYYGLIDGVPVLPLYADPYSVSAPFDQGSASIPAVSAGLPGPTIPGPPAITSIGIQHKFTLTPGDSASFTSVFIVTPEPASLALLAMGGLMMLRRRR